MSRTLYGTLETSLANDVLTLCRCFKITLTSGEILYLTDHDEDLVFNNQTYTSTGGVNISNLESGHNLYVDNAELVTLLSDSAQITASQAFTNAFDNALVEVYLVDYSQSNVDTPWTTEDENPLVMSYDQDNYRVYRFSGGQTSTHRALLPITQKQYVEITFAGYNPGPNPTMKVGVGNSDVTLTYANDPTSDNNVLSVYSGSNGQITSLVTQTSVFGDTFTHGDVIGIAVDPDTGYVWYSKNGVWQASMNPVTGANPRLTNLSEMYIVVGLHRYHNYATINTGGSPYVYDDPFAQGYCQLPGGYITGITGGDEDQLSFSISSLAAKLNQDVGRRISPTCDADVGDSRCGVNLASYTVSSTVTGVAGENSFSDSSIGLANDTLNGGKVTFTTGENAGLTFEIRKQTGTQVWLSQVPPNPIVPGISYAYHRGCDGLSETCKTVFNNYLNYRGFPFQVSNVKMVERQVSRVGGKI